MNRKLWLYTISLLTIFVLAACGSSEEASTWDKVKDGEEELVVGTSGTLVAVSYKDEDSDELTGYDVEVMRAIAEEAGIEVRFEQMGFDGMTAAINSGRIDVAINDIEITEERKENFAFSDPYKYSYTTLVVREDGLSGIETLQDLEGKVNGGAATTVFADIAEHYGATTKTYGNATNDQYLRDVDNGRTDVIINDYYASKLGINAFPQFDLVLHPDIKVHPTEQAIIMSKEDKELQENINKAIDKLKEDGTFAEISKEFFLGEDASTPPEGEIKEIEGIDY